MAMRPDLLGGRNRPAVMTMAAQAPPPTRPRPARGRGGRDSHAGLKGWRLLRRRILGDLPSP
jgi:hypothetical protein